MTLRYYIGDKLIALEKENKSHHALVLRIIHFNLQAYNYLLYVV